MITRDLGDTQIVTAFDLKTFASSETVVGPLAGVATCVAVCACGGPNPVGGFDGAYPGYMIDRLGLRRNFASALIVPAAVIDPKYCASSTVAGDKFFALGYGLQHATATGGTWKNLSTEQWVTGSPLYHRTTTTSTGDVLYENRDSLLGGTLGGLQSSAAATTTSTGVDLFVQTKAGGVFDLAGAGRYLRVVIQPVVPTSAITTTCSAGMRVMASLVFGGADLGPSSTGIFRSQLYVTTGCSTST